MAKYNQSFFQIPQTGMECDWPSVGSPQTRCPSMSMSNFGALNFGARSAEDYTKLAEGFKSKDEIQNPEIPAFTMGGDYSENPFAWGSTTQRVWHDELRIMTLGSRTMAGDKAPMFDVMDTKVSWDTPKDGDMVLNWPTEGYKPWGGRTATSFS
jgi:hypothetical protein